MKYLFAGSIFINKERALHVQVTFAKLLPENWHGSFQPRDLRNSFFCITSCNSISEALKMNTSVSANRILFVSFNWNQSCLNAADFEIT